MSQTDNSAFLLPISQIKVLPNRGRKKFQYIHELAENIKRHGLIHPIVLNRTDNSIIAGERRYRACLMLPILWNEDDEKKYPPSHAARVIVDGKVPVTYRENLKPEELLEIELDENTFRQNLDWPEELDLKERAHALKTQLYGSKTHGSEEGWTVEKTAQSFGEDRSTLTKKLNFAKDLKEYKKQDPSIIERLRPLPISAAIVEFGRIKKTDAIMVRQNAGEIKTTENIKNGNCLELIRELPDNSIDLLVTDPPFGIEEITDATGIGRGESNSYTATLKASDNLSGPEAVELLEKLGPDLYRVLKPSSHFYIFFAWQIYEGLKESLVKAGFEVCPVPLIWDKGRSTSPFRGYEPAPSYEPVLYGHKPPRARRLAEPCRTVFTISPIPSARKMHRFQKPQELLTQFIKLSSNVGDVVLDPFAGSGSTLLAAKSLDRSAIGFELDKDNFHRAQALLSGL